MRARSRRIVTFASLLLAALTGGCGTDTSDVASVVPTAQITTTTTTSDYSLLSGNATARIVGTGSTADVTCANQVADAIHGMLAGGALDVASPLGGAIVNVTTPFSTASSAHGSAVLASRSAVSLASRAVLASVRATVAGTQVVRDEDGKLRIQEPGGVDLTITGATILKDQDGTIDGIDFTDTFRMAGTPDGSRTIDVAVQGVTGTVRPPALTGGDPVVAVTLGSVTVKGTIDSLTVDATLEGAAGSFSAPGEVNAFFSGKDLTLTVRSLKMAGVLCAGSGMIEVNNLQPVGTGGGPALVASSVHGAIQGDLDATYGISQGGRVQQAKVSVPRASALEFDQTHDGPVSGAVHATLMYKNGKQSALTVTYVDGKPQLSGTLTNRTGDEEKVVTEGDKQRVSGTIHFADGRRADHELEVQVVANGRRVEFRVFVQDVNGQTLSMVTGQLKADRTVVGQWSRPNPAGSGTFRISTAGLLELLDSSGTVVAQASMPQGWNSSF